MYLVREDFTILADLVLDVARTDAAHTRVDRSTLQMLDEGQNWSSFVATTTEKLIFRSVSLDALMCRG
jgi:hypothetical protein